MNILKSISFLFLSILFLSCSSDDPEEDPVNPPEQLHGVFLDSEVQGLRYETETLEGTTNEDGEFEYLEGETVTFFVGDIEIGNAVADALLTPVSIASTSNATFSTNEVQNIAAFLQSLDQDNDAANGITIKPEVAEAISVTEIDFTGSIIQLLGEIVAEVNHVTGANLVPVYPEAATLHLAETLGEAYEAEDLAFEFSIPIIESWTSRPRTSIHWIHETDENGKFLRSYMYERRPYRIAMEYSYLEYNEHDQPTKYKQTIYYLGEESNVSSRELVYGEGNHVEGIRYYNTDGSPSNFVEFTQFNDKGRIAEAHSFNERGEFVTREIYVSHDNGNNSYKTLFSTPSGNTPGDILLHTDFEYTTAGELKKEIRTGTTPQNSSVRDFFYRDDHTLEKMVRTTVDHNGVHREDVTFYDENEKRTRLLITIGDYVSDYIEFFDNGDPKKVETYYKGFLYEIITWNEDRSSEWKIIEEDGSYRIEYKDAEEKVQKVEYYDAGGNLVRTENS